MNGWYSSSSKHGYQEPVKFFLRIFCQIDYCEWGKWFISHSTRRQWRQWWRRQIRLKVLLQTFCWTWTPIVATKQQRIVEDKLHFCRVWVNFKTNLLNFLDWLHNMIIWWNYNFVAFASFYAQGVLALGEFRYCFLLLRFIKTITIILLMRFYGLFILLVHSLANKIEGTPILKLAMVKR